jgi:hypothetical protein
MQVFGTDMVNKKGFMRTLEAFVAIMMTILFVIFILPDNRTDTVDSPNINVLEILSQDYTFRNCIIIENYTCVQSYFDEHIDVGYYNYTFNISSDYSARARIRRDNVFLKTFFVAGNDTVYEPKILKLYYWRET